MPKLPVSNGLLWYYDVVKLGTNTRSSTMTSSCFQINVLCGVQCHQMLGLKEAQFFLSCPKSTHSSFYIKSDIFQNHPKSCPIFGTFLLEILLPGPIKITQSVHTVHLPVARMFFRNGTPLLLCSTFFKENLLACFCLLLLAIACSDEIQHHLAANWRKEAS